MGRKFIPFFSVVVAACPPALPTKNNIYNGRSLFSANTHPPAMASRGSSMQYRRVTARDTRIQVGLILCTLLPYPLHEQHDIRRGLRVVWMWHSNANVFARTKTKTIIRKLSVRLCLSRQRHYYQPEVKWSLNYPSSLSLALSLVLVHSLHCPTWFIIIKLSLNISGNRFLFL